MKVPPTLGLESFIILIAIPKDGKKCQCSHLVHHTTVYAAALLESGEKQDDQRCKANSASDDNCHVDPPIASADQWIVDNSLGWRGVLTQNLPRVVDYRRVLLERNCRGIRHRPRDPALSPLEVIDPTEPDFAARAVRIFRRDGFVLVRNVLSPRQLRNLREGAREVAMAILAKDPFRIGNRGSHRYMLDPMAKGSP